MKKATIIFSALLLFSTVTITSCGGEEKKQEQTPTETKADAYECPMKCDGKTYDKPGNCPVCGMELEKIGKG